MSPTPATRLALGLSLLALAGLAMAPLASAAAPAETQMKVCVPNTTLCLNHICISTTTVCLFCSPSSPPGQCTDNRVNA